MFEILFSTLTHAATYQETGKNTHLPSFPKFKVLVFWIPLLAYVSVNDTPGPPVLSLRGLLFPGQLCSSSFPLPTPHCRRNECCCSQVYVKALSNYGGQKKKLYKQKWQYSYGQKPFQHLTIISNDTERPRNQPRREENVRIIIMIFGEWQKGGTDHYYSPQEQHWSLLHLRTLGVLPHIDLKGTTNDPCRH